MQRDLSLAHESPGRLPGGGDSGMNLGDKDWCGERVSKRGGIKLKAEVTVPPQSGGKEAQTSLFPPRTRQRLEGCRKLARSSQAAWLTWGSGAELVSLRDLRGPCLRNRGAAGAHG